jgi:hypothetical protein
MDREMPGARNPAGYGAARLTRPPDRHTLSPKSDMVLFGPSLNKIAADRIFFSTRPEKGALLRAWKTKKKTEGRSP